MTRDTPLPEHSELAGYMSIAPFVLGLAGMAALPTYELRELAQRAVLAYGAVVLGFVGGVHWGLALAGRIAWGPLRLIGAALPILVGMSANVLGGQRGLALLVVGFGVYWLYEHRLLAGGLPPSYVGLRRNLSVAACTLLALAMILSETAGLA